MVPPRIFRRSPRFSVVLVVVFALMWVFNALQYFSTLYYQSVLHLSPLRTSIAFLPMTFSGTSYCIIGATLSLKLRPVSVIAGSLILSMVASILFAFIDPTASYWQTVFPVMLFVTASDLSYAVCNIQICAAVDKNDQALAGGLFNVAARDRTNIGNARIGGLQKSLNITDREYSIALTLTYVTRACVELPGNLLYKRVGPHILMPTMVVLWGIVATMQGFVKSYRGLLVVRVFLGICEGGLLPGVTLYIASFYPRQMLQQRYAFLYTATSLAVLHMDGVGGLDGWAWIFIIEGLMTVVIGVLIAFILPATVSSARYLTPDEKVAVANALALSHGPTDATAKKFDSRQVLETLKSPYLWLISPLFFFNGTRLFGLAVFAPSIVNALIGGNQPIRAQLLTVPPYAAAFIVSVAAAFVADRWGRRGACTIVFATTSIIGYAIFLSSNVTSVNYFALVLQTVGAYGVPPAISAWAANNFSPHYKRATALAVVVIMSVAGGLLSTWIFTDPPHYARATRINLAFAVGEAVFALLNIAYLRRKNQEKAQMIKSSAPQEVSDGGEADSKGAEGFEERVGRSVEVNDRDPEFVYCL
ncbi:MFS general substrate transporter [Exidia glandulosa HHB12029]|uniref:MFS general substrate transporter n=1 Tax=Exidia glandulosa HHB12029 TaxID=1314781 RepID=A0A165NMZ7_EXIGL|nr:MFS general substrate transporter [Exidia glandulosa HHB12029]